MKSERCFLKKLIKNISLLCLTIIVFTKGILQVNAAFFGQNNYYKLDDITIEIGEKIPKEIINYLNNTNNNLAIESNALMDEEGHLLEVGNFSYYLVYNNINYSILTNVRANLTVIDTVKPIIKLKETNEFSYGSDIKASDLAECIDLSKCTLYLDEDVDSTNSGTKEVHIVAVDAGNNITYANKTITILEKPQEKPVIYYDYSSSFDDMNNYNNNLNSTLSNEEKENKRYQIASFSQQFIGNPYVYGGTSLTNGADCSGFTMSIYASFGYKLPRVATSQAYIGIPISENELLPGDLVVYYYGHVGIYIGNGMMVHASTPTNGIIYGPIFSGYKTYRRIIY